MKKITFLLVIIAIFATISQSYAIENKRPGNRYVPQSDKADYMRIKYYPEYATIGSKSRHRAALAVEFANGWHGYWRTPGDTGLSPVFNYDDSKNIAFIKVNWPAPIRYEIFGMQNFGYKRKVSFPLEIDILDTSKDAVVDLKLNFMVCRDICVPQDLHINSTIKAGELMPSGGGYMVNAAFRGLPAKKNNKNLAIETAVISKGALIFNVFSSRGYDNFDFFIEFEKDYLFTKKPIISVNPTDRRRATIVVPAPNNDPVNLQSDLDGNKVTVTITSGNKALEREFNFKDPIKEALRKSDKSQK